MTLLSLTPDLTVETWPAQTRAAGGREGKSPVVARAMAAALVLCVVTVPDAVAHARWAKAGLVIAIVQHRCLASFES